MDAWHEQLIVRSATIDEVLSDDFAALPGRQGDADRAARRLAAWCRACASRDTSLFARRLHRDGWTTDQVLAKFAAVRRDPRAPLPSWIEEAIWIEPALARPCESGVAALDPARPCAFEHLFAPLIEQAEARLWAGIEHRVFANLAESARTDLRHGLLVELSELCAPLLYQRFVKARTRAVARACSAQRHAGSPQYRRFIADMRASGLRRLFDEKPVLLRLIATITRQWLDRSREFVLRLDADLATIRKNIFDSSAQTPVARIEVGLSDPHNSGRSVAIV